MIAALYVEYGGCYYGEPWEIDCWDETRDARLYEGPWPVVAHPPCQLWGNFAHVNYARWGGDHNRPGNDGGCFEAALNSVLKYGGVLEHPAFSNAWKKFNLPHPEFGRWRREKNIWTCEIWQSAYGHKARKRTWLLYSGSAPPLNPLWERPSATHQIGFHDQRGKLRNKPTISGKAASATPIKFRDFLISLAKSALPNRLPWE